MLLNLYPRPFVIYKCSFTSYLISDDVNSELGSWRFRQMDNVSKYLERCWELGCSRWYTKWRRGGHRPQTLVTISQRLGPLRATIVTDPDDTDDQMWRQKHATNHCHKEQKAGSSWSYGNWIYNYLCNQCLSLLRVRISIRARCTLCDKVCQRQVGGFSGYSGFLHQ
jgi:hypothetical protein